MIRVDSKRLKEAVGLLKFVTETATDTAGRPIIWNLPDERVLEISFLAFLSILAAPGGPVTASDCYYIQQSDHGLVTFPIPLNG